jgi:hypothetical protein
MPRVCTNPTQSFYIPLDIPTVELDTIIYRDENLLVPAINGYYVSASTILEVDNDGVVIYKYDGWCSTTTTTSTTTSTTTGAGYNYYYTINFTTSGGNIISNLTFDSTNDPLQTSANTVRAISIPLKYITDNCIGTTTGSAASSTTTLNAGVSVGASNTAISEAKGTTESVKLLGDLALKFGIPGSEVVIMSSPALIVISGNNYYITGYNTCRNV